VEATPLDYIAHNDTLVHGDLYSRHLILDDDSKLTGIIDWGDVHIGDRATDLMIAFTILPPNARRAFFEIYGEVHPLTLELARFRAVNHGLNVVHYAHQVNDVDLLRETIHGMNFVISGADSDSAAYPDLPQ
jgi:aminoglycoside phosphotransferase (APT) family kinase protein